MENSLYKVLNQSKSRSKSRSKSKSKTKSRSKPTIELDPSNPDIQTLYLYMEYMLNEIKSIKEDLDSKVDLSNHNTLSLKVDKLEAELNELSQRIDD